MREVEAVFSEILKNEKRYVLRDKNTKETISTADGFGFLSEEHALSWWWWTGSKRSKEERDRSRRIRRWINKSSMFLNYLMKKYILQQEVTSSDISNFLFDNQIQTEFSAEEILTEWNMNRKRITCSL